MIKFVAEEPPRDDANMRTAERVLYFCGIEDSQRAPFLETFCEGIPSVMFGFYVFMAYSAVKDPLPMFVMVNWIVSAQLLAFIAIPKLGPPVRHFSFDNGLGVWLWQL